MVNDDHNDGKRAEEIEPGLAFTICEARIDCRFDCWFGNGRNLAEERLFAPMAKDAMPRNRSGVRRGRNDQFAPTQILERGLDGAFGKTSRISEHAEAG